MYFAHLHVHSYYSFHDGVSSPKDLVKAAAQRGISAIAITDHNSVSSIVELQDAARAHGVKPILGVELTLEDGYHLVLLAKNSKGYENICKILTQSYASTDRIKPKCPYDVLKKYSENLFALSCCTKGEISCLILQKKYQGAMEAGKKYTSIFGRNFVVEFQNQRLPYSRRVNRDLLELGKELRLRTVLTNNVHYADKQMFPIHDVLSCIGQGISIDSPHPSRPVNGEAWLKSASEMKELSLDYPHCFQTTLEVAEECEAIYSFNENLFPRYFPIKGWQSTQAMLRDLTFRGASDRYGSLNQKIETRLNHELDIICKLKLQDYFLIVWDIVQRAKERGIRHSGRGSAADSAVCYCLGITQVDSIKRDLLFERFLSLERSQKPDIDMDFEADRREEIIQYVYKRFGGQDGLSVAGVCTFSRYRARSAIRDVGAVFNMDEEEIDKIAKKFPYISAGRITEAFQIYPELRNGDIDIRKYKQMFAICEAMAEIPHLIGTHLGGIVISRKPLTCVSPIFMGASGRLITQFDKEYIESLGLVKLDILSLRTLSAVGDCIEQINRDSNSQPPYCNSNISNPSYLDSNYGLLHNLTYSEASYSFINNNDDNGDYQCGEDHCAEEMTNVELEYENIPHDDMGVYKMLQSGETIGVFQLESPAQRALQSRLGADSFEDIVASVALIRPGPIEGNMVEPFIARRNGKEKPSYIHPSLEKILKKTYGVVLFQEQVIEIASAIGGFTPGESDKLRKVMTHARSREDMNEIGELFIEKAVSNGASHEVAKEVFSYIRGYAGYGFCEAHAAAFADMAYRTAWLVRYYPAHYYAAIFNNQPMAYYPTHSICIEAKRRGVEMLPLDINESVEKFYAKGKSIRMGLIQVKEIDKGSIDVILKARSERQFTSIYDFCRRAPIDKLILKNLSLCGAFDSLYTNRKKMLWNLHDALKQRKKDAGLFKELEVSESEGLLKAGKGGKTSGKAKTEIESKSTKGHIKDFTEFEKVKYEYKILGFSPDKHIMDFLKQSLPSGVLSTSQVKKGRDKQEVCTAGLVVRPHRPSTRSGRTVVFLSLEDTEGLIDITVFEDVYQKYGHILLSYPVLIIKGNISINGRGVSVIAREVYKGPVD